MRNKEEHAELAKLLLTIAAKWLKKSNHTKEINIGVYYESDLVHWNEGMNNALGRAPIDKDHLINEICKELNSIIDRNIHGPFKPVLHALKNFLHQSDEIGIESILIQGRKFAEILVMELARKHKISVGGELMSNIEKFREIKMAPWLLSYMHTLRVFGNEGVHIRVDGKTYTPNGLTKSDLINCLTSIRALLVFWEEQNK